MFSKNLLISLLLFSMPIMATGVAPEPVILEEVRFVDDPRANHLPQPMRQGALDFYAGFVRVAATLNHRDEATGLDVVGDEGSVIDRLAPEPVLTVGTDPRAAVNLMNTPFLRFMDSTMLTNGWGRAPVALYPGEPTTDFEEEIADLPGTHLAPVSGVVLPGDIAIPGAGIQLIPVPIVRLIRDEAEIGNPVALYFRAIMRRQGIQGGDEDHVAPDLPGARQLLIQSMKSLNYRAALILADGLGGIERIPYARTFKTLTRNDPVARLRLLEEFIANRANHALLSRAENHFLNALIASLPGDTARWYELYDQGALILEDEFYQAAKPAASSLRIGYNIGMGAVQTAAAVGYFAYSTAAEDGATWGEGAYFAANAIVSWMEVADEVAWACGRDLVATMTCGGVVRRDSLGIPIAYPAETLSKEAKLASIFWVLKRMETARAGDVDGHVRTLTSEIKQTLRLHPVTRGSNISRTVVDYLR